MSRKPPPEVVEAAKASEAKWRVPAVVTLAQWALESSWGAKSPGNNPFGMKPRKGRNDPFQMLPTREFLNGKWLYDYPQPFRTFPTLQAAFEAHAELIATAPVYKSAMDALPDINLFIDRLAPKYATGPEYAKVIKALVAQLTPILTTRNT